MSDDIISVVKVGGAIVEDGARLEKFIGRFAKLPGRKILVHGGGREATKLAERLGIATRMVEGRRVTSADMLRVVTMVYGGLVNKQVVAMLQANGVNAIGLTGADADVMRSHRRPVKNGVDYGFVGDVDKVDGDMLAGLLRQGVTPVMAPLTHDGKGCILNTNADTIAAETAKALARIGETVELTFCFEKSGVLARPDDDGSIIRNISRETFAPLVADGTISGGMIPKITNSLEAVEAGVKRVIITSAETFGEDEGTVIQ